MGPMSALGVMVALSTVPPRHYAATGAMSALGVMVALYAVAAQALGYHGPYVRLGRYGCSGRCGRPGVRLPRALCLPWELLSLSGRYSSIFVILLFLAFILFITYVTMPRRQ